MSLRSRLSHIDFVGSARYWITLSTILVVISLGLWAVKGLNYGIDFSGGTELQIKFHRPIQAAEIRDLLTKIQMQDAMVQSFGAVKDQEFLIRINRAHVDPQQYDALLHSALAKVVSGDNALVSLHYAEDKMYVQFKTSVEPAQIMGVLQGLLKAELSVHDVQLFGKADDHEYVVHFSGVGSLIVRTLEENLGKDAFEMRREDTVGPKVGKELRQKGVMAIFVSLVLLLIYIWFRFDLVFAPGAILCLFHDVMITVGVFAFFGLEMNLTVLAGLLTLTGYSLNDTIVVYDRIRENMKKMKGSSLPEIINVSINQTLSRTIMTAAATLLVTLSLLFLGGEIIHNFALALSFGIVIGMYSTIYIASPFSILVNRAMTAKKV